MKTWKEFFTFWQIFWQKKIDKKISDSNKILIEADSFIEKVKISLWVQT